MKQGEIKTVYWAVYYLLKENERYRNSDAKLWARLIQDNIGGTEALKGMDGYTLLTEIVSGKYPSYESVSRARRKVQEEHPDLRGSEYQKRKDNEEQVKKQLNELTRSRN